MAKTHPIPTDPRFQDLTGRIFGRFFVLCFSGKVVNKFIWKCRCQCGNIKTIRGNDLKQGRTQSCGCLHIEKITRHGQYKSRTYTTWQCMIRRCQNKTDPGFYNYGNRGITVCERWKNFNNFLLDMGHRPEGKSIDRINNSLGYFPGNCRWATSREQSQNRRDNNVLTFNGITLCLEEWARRIGISRPSLADRLNCKNKRSLNHVLRKR